MTTTNSILQPTSIAELADAVKSAARVIPVGAATKPRLSQAGNGTLPLSTAGLRGIVEYDPTEYTFTALAGTPVREIVSALAEKGQGLPFDPLLSEAGATLGGTVAAGLSGPGRFRYGGLRDFILWVKFVDGEGRVLRMGGKVVKNAAGFDLPKFFVGSLGRFGVLAEITFKVFPRPVSTRTLRLTGKDAAALGHIFSGTGNSRWELDALEASPGEGVAYARLAGPAVALEVLANEILSKFPGSALEADEGNALWQRVNGFGWAHAGGTLVKVALTPSQVPEFVAWANGTSGARTWIGAGGNVGWLSLPAEATLPKLAWPALTLRGQGPLWSGVAPRFEVMKAVKAALDPRNRFPGLDE
jgi:glycolate oxidase FAD binding subunit